MGTRAFIYVRTVKYNDKSETASGLVDLATPDPHAKVLIRPDFSAERVCNLDQFGCLGYFWINLDFWINSDILNIFVFFNTLVVPKSC